MTVMEQVSEAQDRVLEDVKTAQARVVEANERFIETAGQWIPKVDLPRGESISIELPTREELVASYFDFASRMLEANRTFVEQLFGVWNTAQDKPAKTSRARTKAA
jgi:hypothetical protein